MNQVDEQAFASFLKRGGRSPSAVRRCLTMVLGFESFASQEFEGVALDEVGPEVLAAYVRSVEQEPKASAKTHLWALRYYYRFNGNDEMHDLARALREARIERTPFALQEYRGVDVDQTARLTAAGIRNVQQMLKASATPKARAALAARTALPCESILEFVKLSDLARIPGVKAMLVEFAERTGFEGMAPLPKEAAFSVETARSLPQVVED